MKYSKAYGFYYTNRKEYEKKRHMSERGKFQQNQRRGTRGGKSSVTQSEYQREFSAKIVQMNNSIEDLKKSIDYLVKSNVLNSNLNKQTLDQFFD